MTKEQFVTYDPEEWTRRQHFLHHLKELELRESDPQADTVELVDNTPRQAWPARPPKE